MKKSLKCMVAGFMSLAVLTTAVMHGEGEKEVQAAKVTYTRIDYETCAADRGYAYIPNVEGEVPAVVFAHGLGGMKKDYYNVLCEKWINDGYLKPFALIMPFIENVGHNAYVCKDYDTNNVEWLGKLIKRMDNGKFDTETTKLDKDGYSFAGYSMGGASAILAGVAYSDKFVNIGAGSPAQFVHDPANGVSWLMGSSETKSCKFTDRADKHLMLTSGYTGQEEGHYKTAKRVYDAVNEINDNAFAQIAFDYGSHDHNLFAQEFFVFLYYTQYDKMPSDDVLKSVFGSNVIKRKEVKMPAEQKESAKEEPKKEEPKQDTLSKPVIESVKLSLEDGTVKMGQNYTVTVNAKGENLKYQWEWCTDGKSWKNSQCVGNNTKTNNLVGKRPIVYYRCKVSNKNGTVTSDAVVIKDEATVKPAIQSVKLSLEDGTVKMGQNYTITANATGEDLKYQWEWCTDGKSWKNSQCVGNNTKTINLVGKRPIVYYRCKVSKYKGTVTSEVVVIKEAK